jgi:hypothetical protein
MTITRRAVLAASVVSLGLSTTIMAGLQDSEPPRVIGRWDMAVVASGTTYPSWLEVQRSGTRTLVGRFVGSGGSARPISKIDFADNVLRFSIPPQWEQGDDDLRLEGTLDGDRLSGWMTDPAGKRLTWTASRAPTLRRTSPPEWGAPIRLLDGTDMAAWQPSRESQWRLTDGVLANIKAGANLVTRQRFNDFRLHLEFRCPKDSNSGVYLRGRYELQIEDSAGLEPASGVLGAVYGFLPPKTQPGSRVSGRRSTSHWWADW